MDREIKESSRKKKSVIREWIEAFAVAAVLVIFIKAFFFQIYKIPTTSMQPTLLPGDRIFVSKLVYGPKVLFTDWRMPGFRKPKRGEIIVFIPPQEAKKKWYAWKKHYIKRLIGLPGERILIKNGNIYVNGEMLTDPLFANIFYRNYGTYGQKGKEIVVPEDKYFFLGDNSKESSDSRYWGFVDYENVIGKAIFIWWPLKRIGIIE